MRQSIRETMGALSGPVYLLSWFLQYLESSAAMLAAMMERMLSRSPSLAATVPRRCRDPTTNGAQARHHHQTTGRE